MTTSNFTLRIPNQKTINRCNEKNYRKILRDVGYFDKYIAKTIQNIYSKNTKNLT